MIPPPEVPPPPEPREPDLAVNRTARITALAYGRFGEPDGPDRVSGAELAAHLEYLAAAGIPVISLTDYLWWKSRRLNLPPRSVLITVDDPDSSFFEFALPALGRFGVPFTVFVPAEGAGEGSSGPPLSPTQFESIALGGGEIGSLGWTPSDLTSAPEGADPESAGAARRRLTDLLQWEPRAFAYPFGLFDDAVRHAHEESGYPLIFTLAAQPIGWDSNPTSLPRYPVVGRTGPAFLAAVTGRTAAGAEDGTLPGSRPALGWRVQPPPGSLIVDRFPRIEIEPPREARSNVRVFVSGLGELAVRVEPESGRITGSLPRALRTSLCRIEVAPEGDPAGIAPFSWEFSVDLSASYFDGSGSFRP